MGLIPAVQAQRLKRLAQFSDETVKIFLKKEQIEQAYEKLWIQAAGDKKDAINMETQTSDRSTQLWEPYYQ